MHKIHFILPTLALLAACIKIDAGDGDLDSLFGDGNSVRAAAQALTQSMRFDGGSLEDGDIPPNTAPELGVFQLGDVEVSPDQNGVFSLEFDNPDEETNAVIATLVRLQDSDGHFKVMRDPEVDDGESGSGRVRLQNRFSVGADACDELCDRVFDVPVLQALERADGSISARVQANVRLDCRGHGKPERCAGPDDGAFVEPGETSTSSGRIPNSGLFSGGGSAGSDSESAAAERTIAAFQRIAQALCPCTEDLCEFATPDALQCQLDTAQRYAAEIADWLECAAEWGEMQATCIEQAGCDFDRISACGFAETEGNPFEDACGVLPTSIDQEFSACGGGFACRDGGFVPFEAECDGYPDCADGSDEASCGGVGTDGFYCGDDSMVPYSAVCDGVADCPDGSDEYCTPMVEPPPPVVEMTTCSDGSSTPGGRCDGVADCPDGFDEGGCYPVFGCFSGGEVESTRQCDGDNDCPDASDENCGEIECLGQYLPSSALCDGVAQCEDSSDEAFCGLFTCREGQPIAGYSVCDGVLDCPDGADERNCSEVADPSF